jgi:hypothetical protein
MALWERVSQLGSAIGAGEPDLLPAQFPYAVGDPWLALELPHLAWLHLNPSSGLDNDADLDCSAVQVAAKFAVVGDFDGDGRDEIAAAEDAPGTRGNDFWVMDYDPGSGRWRHLNPGSGLANDADLDCAPDQVAAKFAVAGDVDGDGRAELVVAKDIAGTRGNDFWVMDYGPAAGRWSHLGDFDCSAAQVAAKFAVVGDFDGDGRDEVAIAPDAPGTRGNDFWVMKYDPATGRWRHLSPGSGLANDADLDCAPDQVAAKFAVAGDVDGDGRAELVVAKDTGGTRGNDFWVMKYDPAGGRWSHLADFDCSGAQVAAKFAVVGDFDGDGRDEVAIAPDAPGTRGNDFWVMDYDPATRRWAHLSPGSGLANDADVDSGSLNAAAKFAVAGDFDGDGRDELAMAKDVAGTRGNDFWVKDYDPVTRLWTHLGPAPRGHGESWDFDCSAAEVAAKFAVAGDFDGNGRAEIAAAEAIAGTRGNDFWVLGYDPAPWSLPGDRLLYTAHYDVPFDPEAQQCALLLDEWTEIIPSTTATTAIAAHYDRPGTQPPQTMLLVAPPARTGAWSWDDLLAAVGETLDLVKIRAVEPGHLDGTPYAQLLPATVLSAAARAITLTTDLSINNAAPLRGGPFRPARG